MPEARRFRKLYPLPGLVPIVADLDSLKTHPSECIFLRAYSSRMFGCRGRCRNEPAQLRGDLFTRISCRRDQSDGGNGIVNLAAARHVPDAHARSPERRRVGDAFVAQGVEFTSHNKGRGQVREIAVVKG